MLFSSSYGQNLSTSTFIGETSFAILIAIVGLVLFAHLIGNMQVSGNKLLLFLSHVNLVTLSLKVYKFYVFFLFKKKKNHALISPHSYYVILPP